MGRFIFTLFSALAQLEREQIAERTSNAMLQHQSNGRRMTHAARCPFGKQPDPLDPTRLVDHPGEQAAIAVILAAHSQGKGLKAIARFLEAVIDLYAADSSSWVNEHDKEVVSDDKEVVSQ